MKSRMFFGLTLATILLLLSMVFANQARSSSRGLWEYKVVQVQAGETHLVEQTLNKLGTEGWELVSHDSTPGGIPTAGFYYFKRLK